MDLLDILRRRQRRDRLQVAVIVTAMITAGLLTLLLLSPAGDGAAMPGPLSSHHAHLRERCDLCHAESLWAVQGPTHGFVPTGLDLEQSAKCQRCHDLGEHGLLAHSWSPEEVVSSGAAVGFLEDLPSDSGGQVPCSTCHVEHEGRYESLTELSGARCQVCHTETYASFDAHAPFTRYPHARRTGIVFDHASHIGRHFPADETGTAPSSCSDCHVLGRAGRRMLVTGYDDACASCHDDEIGGSSQVDGMGLAFLVLPAIDVYTLMDEGYSIGEWPADSSVTEAPLSPYMELLLAADPEVAGDLARVRDLDLLDLTGATAEELAAVERVAWEAKELFAEIREAGHRAVLSRMGPAGFDEASGSSGAGLLGGLPEDLLRRALDAWLPSLDSELEARGGGGTPDSEIPFVETDLERHDAREDWVATGGWYLDDLDFSVRYRPGGHADPFLRSWIDFGATLPGAGRVFSELVDPASPGMCAKCHSVDRKEEGGFRVHWYESAAVERGPSLTSFSHSAHLNAASENVCVDCHRLARESEDYLASFRGTDPFEFTSNFGELSVSDCAECHRSGEAPSECLTCHGYHAPSSVRGSASPLRSALR